MTCWNNLDIDYFWPKCNDDMIQYVTCNKSWLFAPRQKNSEKQRKEKYPSGTRKNSNVFEINFSNSFLYEIEA
jgi:hypothetical protein